MSKPIVVRLTKRVRAYDEGAELGFKSEADAAKVLGDDAFTVVRYQDGSAYEASSDNEPVPLSKMTRPQLDAYAADLGVTGEFANKDELRQAIENHLQDVDAAHAADEGTA